MKLYLILQCICATIFAAVLATPNTSISDGCTEQGDCLSGSNICNNKCGCDSFAAFYYNTTADECTLDVRALMLSLVNKHKIEERLHNEADKVFQGILIAAILIITCAGICVISACFYCCRINYYDYKLESDVKALQKKSGHDKVRQKSAKAKTEPKAESCNVVVQDAGLFEIRMYEISNMVNMTVLGIIITMALISCVCCVSMKLSDYRLKSHIIRMANRRGLKVNLEKPAVKYKGQYPQSADNCTIIVPEVGIIL